VANVPSPVDLGLDGRYYDSIVWDRRLPGERGATRADSFYDTYRAVASVTGHL
jgi:hypothetical protein